MHHGRIWAENAEPGLLICVDLPLDHLSVKSRRTSSTLHARSSRATADELEHRTADR
jgi:hypothetical protein